jgi:ABC-type glycerol-3-phosphate transport system substrate-binding protein
MKENTTHRRKVLKGIATGAGAVSIAGCLGGGGGQGNNQSNGQGNNQSNGQGKKSPWVYQHPQAQNTQELVALNLGSMSGDPAIQAHFEKFKKKTGIKIDPLVVPSQDAPTKARTQLQGKSSKVDIYNLQHPWAMDLGTRGFFERLNSYIDTFDAWVPGVQQVSKWPLDLPGFDDYPYPKGIYMPPAFGEGWIPFANMDVLEKAGLSREFRPKSFKEMYNAMDQLSDVVKTPLLFPFANKNEGLYIFYDLVQRCKGTIYNNGSFDVTNQGFIQALDFFHTSVKRGYIPQGITSLSEGTATTQFYSGNSGFMFNALGNLFLPGKDLPIKKPAQEVARVMLYPTPYNYTKAPTGHLMYIANLVSIFSKNKKAAAKYANYVTTKEAQADEIVIEGNMPLRADVMEMQRVKKNVPYSEVIKQHLAGYEIFVYPQTIRADEIMYQEISKMIANYQQTTPKQTAQQIQQRLQGI